MPVEQPLRRVAGKRLRQSVRIFLRRHLLPVRKVEGNFDKRCVRDLQLLVNLANCIVKLG